MTTRTRKPTRPQVIDANRMYTARELESRGIGRSALVELIRSGQVKYRYIGTKAPWILGEELIMAAAKGINETDSKKDNQPIDFELKYKTRNGLDVVLDSIDQLMPLFPIKGKVLEKGEWKDMNWTLNGLASLMRWTNYDLQLDE